MKIKQKFDFVSGEFDTDTIEMICLPYEKYASVELCFKDGANFPIAEIKLHSKDRYGDAMEVFDSAVALGREIAERWNAGREKAVEKFREEK